MPTNAFATFEASFADAEQLIKIYETQRTSAAPEKIEVLKRASVILAVTAWETYVEDLVQENFPVVLANATSTSDLPSAFEQVAKRWLKNPGSLTAPGVMSWTGDGWKTHIQKFFTNQINAFNTPNSANVQKLVKDFLHIDLADVWNWQGHNYKAACTRLDEIVSKRGAFTHEARRRSGSVPTKDALSRPQVIACLKFFKEIAETTDKAIQMREAADALPIPRSVAKSQ